MPENIESKQSDAHGLLWPIIAEVTLRALAWFDLWDPGFKATAFNATTWEGYKEIKKIIPLLSGSDREIAERFLDTCSKAKRADPQLNEAFSDEAAIAFEQMVSDLELANPARRMTLPRDKAQVASPVVIQGIRAAMQKLLAESQASGLTASETMARPGVTVL